MLLPLDGPAVYGNISVTTSATELKVGASALAERKVISIQPSDGVVWYGYDSSVTTSNGTKIFKDQQVRIEASETLSVYLITDTGTVDVRIAEIS